MIESRTSQLCPVYFPVIGGVEECKSSVNRRLTREHELTPPVEYQPVKKVDQRCPKA